jgi:NAD(P)-dependent dehydrogenase (short-subunit alcohol dehydrogenase family)
VVSGGGSGIGRACAQRLAVEGARVAILDLDEQAAAHVAAELSGPGEHLALHTDVTDRTSVDHGVATVIERFGGLDVLVAVAGGDMPHSDVEHTDDEVWRVMLELNLLGAVRCCRAAIPHLRRSIRGPAIVMISSVNALTGIGSEAYSSAKAGLGALTRNLAVQLGPAGIRVNTVAPGTVRTRVWDRQEGGADRMTSLYPLGRVGEPEDIAAGVAFLASADAAWITGLVMPIDGGLLAGHHLPGPAPVDRNDIDPSTVRAASSIGVAIQTGGEPGTEGRRDP